ncbi:MAG: type I restriction enzyme HsdR N-terminal domain-containing protein [Prevotella sp.]|nr:type I restriction enzyme HsdR N-terminal domain-containing protein [Prevotella sp.]
MIPLNLPPYEHKVRKENGRLMIFDILRRKYVALTPEEWVRQHFVHFLTEHKGYPPALLANEVELRIGEKRLRCDTVLYDNRLQPRMIMEYKAPSVTITQQVFEQIRAYNLQMHVDYLIVSNGLAHYCLHYDRENNQYVFLDDTPTYESI